MSLTASQLDTLFQNANIGEAPDAATQLLLAAYAEQTQEGSLTDAQALLDALHIPPPADGSVGSNTPEDTTDVAVGVYQFFTGSAPTVAGLQFLVNGTTNPNDLDSAYYAGFNQANRYYNFAINLITGNPTASANFAATYGAATFDQVVTAAYELIVGTPNVGAAAAAAAIAAIEAQQSYFASVASEIAPTVNQDLATKAIAIAYIIEEGVKADVGYYAFAIDQFDIALANGQVPAGETSTGDNIIATFPINPNGQVFTLTPGVDTITPPSTNNNVVNATELTLNSFDSINLGTTTGNVLNWVDSSNFGGFEFAVPFGVSVNDVQTANFASKEALFLNVQGWTGLETLNVVSFQPNVGDNIFVDPGVAVNVNDTMVGDNFGSTDGLRVTGGSVITITENNGSHFSDAPITVNGDGSTTTVTIDQTVTTGDFQNIEINDNAATIANVNINGLDGNEVDINGGPGGVGLTNLSLANASDSDVFISNLDGSPAALTVTLDNDHFIFMEDDGGYTTLNVVLGADASGWEPDFSSVTTENISGASTLFQVSEDMTALEAIVISGGAGLTDFDLVDSNTLTSIDASASSGPITVEINDEQTSFLGGAGADFVIVFADATVTVAGGSAGDNEIVFNVPGADLTAGGTYANVTGFEILGTAFNSVGTYNLEGFSNPTQIADVDVRYAPAGALVFTGSASDQTLSIDMSTGSNGAITLIQGSVAAHDAHDTLNLILGTAGTDGIDTSNIGSGFVNPVGTDVSVAHHTGTTTTAETFTAGLPEISANSELMFTTVLAGGTETLTLTGGDAVTISNATNNPTTEAAAFAAAINADPVDGAIVHATSSGDDIFLTSTQPGATGDFTGTLAASAGETVSVVVNNPGQNATPATGTLTVTNTDTVANQLNFSDSAGTLNGFVALLGGESTTAAATAIGALLTADGFTGVTVTASTVHFTYPNVGDSGLVSADTVAQVDTISLAGVSVASGDIFSETFTGNGHTETVTDNTGITGDSTDAQVAATLAAKIDALTGTTDVVATSDAGGNLFLTEATGDATMSFTSSQVSEESFNPSFVPVGSQAITANGYETLDITSNGTGIGVNTTFVVDNALTDLIVTGGESLNIATLGGAITAIDTSGASGDINLFGILPSEATTGITAVLGDASVAFDGNAGPGSTDVIVGGDGNDSIFGSENGGNTDVTLGNGIDQVQLFGGSANAVSLGNGNGDTVIDASNGNDTVTLGNGVADVVLDSGGGNSTISVGNGHNDVVVDDGSGANTIHAGNGAADTVVLGAGMDTVTFGTGAGDDAVFNATGIGAVTFSGVHAVADFSDVFGPSFLTPTTTSQVDILTNNVNVVTGMVAGDSILLPTADVLATAHNMAGVSGEAVFTDGTYNAAAGTFTESLTGHDALLTYDSGGSTFVSVVLVGGAAEASHATISGDTITF